MRADNAAPHGAVVFGGFEDTKDERAKKRWFASTGTSLLIFVVVGIALVILAKQQTSAAAPEPEIDVTFRAAPEVEEAAKPPPPPPPPPKASGPKPKRPGKPAPSQVNVIPETRPEEAEPTGDFDPGAGAIEEFGDGELGGGVVEAKAPPPPPPPPPPPRAERIPDPVSEVDPGVVAPRAAERNAMPVYPDAARKKGLEAEVVLKIKISARGEVVAVEVLRGDEPFASAAKTAVKTWRYAPATVDGKPAAFVKLVRIPFRLQK